MTSLEALLSAILAEYTIACDEEAQALVIEGPDYMSAFVYKRMAAHAKARDSIMQIINESINQAQQRKQ